MSTYLEMKDTVLLPVPIEHLLAVAVERDRLMAGGEPPTPVNEPATGDMGLGWDQDRVTELARSLSYPKALELLDACAADPEVWVLKATIDADGDPSQLRNELGAMTKLIRRTFGRTQQWPIDYQKYKGKYQYRMSPTIAAWWLAARRGASR